MTRNIAKGNHFIIQTSHNRFFDGMIRTFDTIKNSAITLPLNCPNNLSASMTMLYLVNSKVKHLSGGLTTKFS